MNSRCFVIPFYEIIIEDVGVSLHKAKDILPGSFSLINLAVPLDVSSYSPDLALREVEFIQNQLFSFAYIIVTVTFSELTDKSIDYLLR